MVQYCHITLYEPQLDYDPTKLSVIFLRGLVIVTEHKMFASECLRIWQLNVAGRKIRPTDIKTGPIKRIIRLLQVCRFCGFTPSLPISRCYCLEGLIDLSVIVACDPSPDC